MVTQLINFTISKLLLKDIDFMAKKKRASRSELLRQAVRAYLEEEETRATAFSLVEKTAKKINLSEDKAMKLAQEAQKWARRQNK
ncbi:CopG family transcriptional regulator [Candidatus Beckwithbacteria bacterium CG10_big_fil_rev_8_21_14_0_10_34_10]|uniref:CopG family transcriptional regulator n=1 Tax=Candidatus Beckwithbacteria bacterium CG10_big_fil_rev_8_21_14_0_10_34_10 TaxID=1974495 RepID=A0A2H0W8P7_9BACT|nr:MAG: CopG family transcriptional regulator [Candidatus Beckwithbacteria bacterium CG10_big_fil_rev_8_21_14_0_10_34_10]